MDQRVSIVEGKHPILLIAPSGATDKNTDIVAEQIATMCNCYAVINWGWQRCHEIDFRRDKADCNNINHLKGIVYDEFLEPILRFKNRITRDHRKMYQFVLQGVAGNDFPNSVDAVIGEGAEANSNGNASCEDWFRNLFIYLAAAEGIHASLARPGTSLAGCAKKNLNQLFVQWYPDKRVQSVQVEIVLGLRESKIDAEIFAAFFANTLSKLLEVNRNQASAILPNNYKPSTI